MPSENKGFASIPLIILISIAMVVAFAYRKSLSSVGNWKTYTNARYGYTFEYPTGTKISWPYEPEGAIFVAPKDSQTMWIRHRDNPKSLTAKEFYENALAEAEREAQMDKTPRPIPPAGGTKEIKINGLDAFQSLGNFAGDGSMAHTYLTNGKVVVDISFYDFNANYTNTEESAELFNEILSTFKFN